MFADGTTVTVEPTDLSGTFDKLFWIAAATISTDSQTGMPVTQESIAEVRAYGRMGILIGTAISPGPGQLGEEPWTQAVAENLRQHEQRTHIDIPDNSSRPRGNRQSAPG